MAWTPILTTAGAALLASAFGGTLNYTRIKAGAGTVGPAELENQTDVTDYFADVSITSIDVSGVTSSVRGLFVNTEITAPTPLTQMGLFANVNNGDEALLMIYQNDSPMTIPASSQPWKYEPQLNVTAANIAKFTANIDWSAFATQADIKALQDEISALVGFHVEGPYPTLDDVGEQHCAFIVN
jgi:hypothetical protein